MIISGTTNASSSQIVDWCRIDRKSCLGLVDFNRIACSVPKDDDEFCTNYNLINLSQEDKQNLVSQLNRNRNRIAGGLLPELPVQTAKMIKVAWSDNLEYLAQKVLITCKTGVYCLIVNDTQNPENGEFIEGLELNYTDSINYKTNLNDIYREVVDSWLTSFRDRIKQLNSDVEKDDANALLPKLAEQETHFGILFGAQSLYRIGCAFALTSHTEYPSESDEEQKIYLKYFCALQFKVMENYKITVGPPCSLCNATEMHCSNEYPNLCENSSSTLIARAGSLFLIILFKFCILKSNIF